MSLKLNSGIHNESVTEALETIILDDRYEVTIIDPTPMSLQFLKNISTDKKVPPGFELNPFELRLDD